MRKQSSRNLLKLVSMYFVKSESKYSSDCSYIFSFRYGGEPRTRAVGDRHLFRVVLGWAYRGLTGGFLLLQNFSVAISVSPHVCFILVLILISMFLR